MKHEIDLPDLPDGFEYTGEYREVQNGEYILRNSSGMMEKAWSSGQSFDKYLILKKVIKPVPLTCLERIKAEYAEYDVVELGFDYQDMLCILEGPREGCWHCLAQSMKGFYRYVYIDEEALVASIRPVRSNGIESRLPVAVLFSK